MANWPMKKI